MGVVAADQDHRFAVGGLEFAGHRLQCLGKVVAKGHFSGRASELVDEVGQRTRNFRRLDFHALVGVGTRQRQVALQFNVAKHSAARLAARRVVARELLGRSSRQEVAGKRHHQLGGVQVHRRKGAYARQGFPDVEGIGLRNGVEFDVLEVGVALAQALDGGLK